MYDIKHWRISYQILLVGQSITQTETMWPFPSVTTNEIWQQTGAKCPVCSYSVQRSDLERLQRHLVRCHIQKSSAKQPRRTVTTDIRRRGMSRFRFKNFGSVRSECPNMEGMFKKQHESSASVSPSILQRSQPRTDDVVSGSSSDPCTAIDIHKIRKQAAEMGQNDTYHISCAISAVQRVERVTLPCGIIYEIITTSVPDPMYMVKREAWSQTDTWPHRVVSGNAHNSCNYTDVNLMHILYKHFSYICSQNWKMISW